MLKNKIHKYLSNEILKNFITILLTFTAIAWVVRSVNFLDLMVEDGYSSSIYFKYSVLNITTIITRFVPLAFLISLTISIIKFERQQELLIMWTSGQNKMKIANIFLLIAFFIMLFQIVVSIFVNPFLLNKSRFLLSDEGTLEINSILKSNDFSDTFKGLTFYIHKKNTNNELLNIFIKDVGSNLTTVINNAKEKKDTTIVAKKGYVINNKLILYDGTIQTLNQKKEFKNIQFKKTEISLNNLSTRTIKQPKIQETSTHLLFLCVLSKNNLQHANCSSENYKGEVVQTISRRLGAPLYIPLIAAITLFLLIGKREKRYNFVKKYILFILSFSLLILSEIFLKFTSISLLFSISYFVLPVIMFAFCYLLLLKKITSERIIK